LPRLAAAIQRRKTLADRLPVVATVDLAACRVRAEAAPRAAVLEASAELAVAVLEASAESAAPAVEVLAAEVPAAPCSVLPQRKP